MRNRYLDLLRAVAIVRVVVYHLFGWPWLSIVLPAMGIMFALAGSLTATSLDRRNAGSVIRSRLRRLLPPLWLLGLISVPVMVSLGWAHESDGTHPFSPVKLLLWIVPIADPPGSEKGVDVWDPLWYVRAYLWFVLLSPVMYAVYKKLGWVVVAAPIMAIAVLDKTGFSLPDAADAAMWDFVTFGACWIVGFAHHDGRLARTRPTVVIGAAAVLAGAALYWLRGHAGEDGYDLNDVAESQALWSLAFVLLVLRWQPPMDWLGRVRALDRVVTLLNARAVTIYLWHNIAIDAVWPVLAVLALDDVGHLTDPVELATALAITGAAVLAFGWVEDLAARRRPRLLPLTASPGSAPAAALAADGDVHRTAIADAVPPSAVDRPRSGRAAFQLGGPPNHAADDVPVLPDRAQHRHDGGTVPWNAVTMPHQRADFGMPPAEAGPYQPVIDLDLPPGFGRPTGDAGRRRHPPGPPMPPPRGGEPPTGRSNAPVPWFGGDG